VLYTYVFFKESKTGLVKVFVFLQYYEADEPRESVSAIKILLYLALFDTMLEHRTRHQTSVTVLRKTCKLQAATDKNSPLTTTYLHYREQFSEMLLEILIQ